MDYDFLKKLNKKTPNFDKFVISILSDFMFKDLMLETSVFCSKIPNEKNKEIWENHIKSINRIRHSIINYLYSGSFALEENDKTYDYSKAVIELISKNIKPTKYISPDDFFKLIEKSWKKIFKLYQDYLNQLKKKLEKDKKTIDKIIVYEAPPYKDPDSKNYFLTNRSSKYYTPILNCFNPKIKLEPINFLVDNSLGFFDISIACLPLSEGKIRKSWNTNENFKIGNKQITVVLFELSFKHFIAKIGIDNISSHPLFAIGAPVNSSAGIFEYYSENLLKVYCPEYSPFDLRFEPTEGYINKISVDLSATNSTTTYKKCKAPGETFPMYKSNVVNSGYPSDILMKNAFNMESD